MEDDLMLRLPRRDEEPAFLRAHRATSPEYPTFLHGYRDGMPFGRYLDVLAEQSRGLLLRPGQVPSTFLFAFVGDRIVGRVSIRHALHFERGQLDGHIGYVVVPAERRRGYATQMLRQAVHIAHDRLRIAHVLVTCDDDNIASMRTIEACGGCFDDIVRPSDAGKPKRRYRFDRGRLDRGD